MNTPMTLDSLIQECASSRDLASFQRLAHSGLPHLLGLAGHFLEKPHPEPHHLDQHRPDQLTHGEAVCRDTLLLAWRNLPDDNLYAEEIPSQWLYRIFGSVLYNRLLAIHGGESALLTWLESRQAAPIAMMDSPTGPRPALFSGEQLAQLTKHTTATPPSQQLQQELERLIQAEIDQLSAPLTPTGERVHPLLYDPELRGRMLRSRAAFRFKEGFKRCLGRPLEDWLFKRWLDNKPGSAALERQGLLRRSVEAFAEGKHTLELNPTVLTRGIDFHISFPDRSQRRKVSNLFLWAGDWDIRTHKLTDTHRQVFIQDIWRHRLDLTTSDSYTRLIEKLKQGQPLRLHHQGILANSPERILGYLDQYRLYMEDMSCFGFKANASKDQLGVVIDRHGRLIKGNKGLHRLAMAQTLNIQCITVRVRAVHQLWWQNHKGIATGRDALEKIIGEIEQCNVRPWAASYE